MADPKKAGKQVRQKRYNLEGRVDPSKTRSAVPASKPKPVAPKPVPVVDLSAEFVTEPIKTQQWTPPPQPTGRSAFGGEYKVPKNLQAPEYVGAKPAEYKVPKVQKKYTAVPKTIAEAGRMQMEKDFLEMQNFKSPAVVAKQFKPAGKPNYLQMLRNLLSRAGGKKMVPMAVGGAVGGAVIPEMVMAEEAGAPTLRSTGAVPPKFWTGFTRPNPFMTIGQYGAPEGVVGRMQNIPGYDIPGDSDTTKKNMYDWFHGVEDPISALAARIGTADFTGSREGVPFQLPSQVGPRLARQLGPEYLAELKAKQGR